MKKNDLATLRQKEVKDLEKMIKEKKIELAKTQVNRVAGKEKNVKKASILRREISQILTIVREGEILKKEEVK